MKRYIISFTILLLSLLTTFWLLSRPVTAASNIVVTTTDDVVADDGFCSLREAIIAANGDAAFHDCTAGSGNDTIQFDPALPKPATFVLTIAGTGEEAALTGDLDLTGPLTISGDGQDNTIIDGNAIDRPLHIHPAANVSVTGVTVRNGNPGAFANGGGIAIELTGRLTLSDSTVISNTAVLGGGVYGLGGLTINDSTVKANQGGGLHNKSGFLILTNGQVLNNSGGYGITNELLGQMQVTGGRIRENSGGGIKNDNATTELRNLTIDLNTIGGGLHNKGIDTAKLTITNSSINNNAGTSGAGLLNEGLAATATIENSRISFNNASAAGGGINNTGILILKNSTIDNNQARTGGGIDHQGVSLNAQNVTISGNTASDNGGGIANQTGSTLINVTISGNGASGSDTGGNIFNDGDLPQITFVNTIVANPGPGGNCVNSIDGTLNSLGHNLESSNSCAFTATGDMINADPLLGPLQDNGGPTPTHALLPGSPVIDHGDDAKCPVDDQRGVLRPVGPSCDIGSVEANGVTPVYAVDLSSDDAKSGADGQIVAYTLQLTNNGNMADTFDLSTSGNSWATDLSDTTVTLPAGHNTNITANVSIPAGTLANDTDLVTITALSQGDPSKNDVAMLTTTVTVIYRVSLSPDQAKSAQPGQLVTYTSTVTNTGNLTDTLGFTVNGNNWTTDLSDISVTMPAGHNTNITATVTIPAGALGHDTDAFTITALSQSDPSKSDVATLTTTVTAVYGVSLSPDQAKSAQPGQPVSYTLTLTNTGNLAGTFDLTVSGNSWITDLSDVSVSLLAGHTTNITATVTIPSGALIDDTDAVTITALSQGDPSKSDVATLTTTVTAVYGVSLSPDQAKSAQPGQPVTYTLTVTNTGNLADTFDLTVNGNNWTTALSDVSVTLPAGHNTNITATVTIPAGALANDTDLVTIIALSHGDPSKSDTAILTTSITAVYGVSLSPDQAKSAQPGQSLNYTLMVTNTGNLTDTFNLTVSSNTWPSNLSDTNVILGPGLSTPVIVVVNIPADTANNVTDVASISATSRTDTSKNATTLFTTTSFEFLHLYLPVILSSG